MAYNSIICLAFRHIQQQQVAYLTHDHFWLVLDMLPTRIAFLSMAYVALMHIPHQDVVSNHHILFRPAKSVVKTA